MTTMFDVTVITPTTGRDTLTQCRESVAAQRVPCAHLVIPDDSNDWGYTPRNRAIPNVHTPYVAMLDDDDWYAPDFAGVMLDALRETNADMVYCRSNLISKNDDVYVGSWFYPFNAATLETSAYILCNTVLARRELFARFPYNRTAWGYDADWHVYLDAARQGFKIVSVDATLSNCRVKDGAWRHWAAGGFTPAEVTA